MSNNNFDHKNEGECAVENYVGLSIEEISADLPFHKHSYYEISYVAQGKGVHNVNGISYPVEKGDIILFSKNDIHSCHPVKGLKIITCCFVSIENLNYFPFGSNSLLVSLSKEQMVEVEALFKTIEIELKIKNCHFEHVIQNCIDMILLIMGRQNENKVSFDPLWGNLLSYVSDNYHDVTLEDATDIMRMSKSYFCRKFKQQFSVSFLTYVNQIRIQQAQKLLNSTNLTIPEISERIGYGNNLCRLHEDFKKFTHTTPHKYKMRSVRIDTPTKHTERVQRSKVYK